MPTTADDEGRPPLLAYVDTVSLEWAVGLSVQAGLRGIATALVCPPGSVPEFHGFAEVVETDDYDVHSIEAVMAGLERRWRLCGITSSFGAFRDGAFIHQSVAEAAGRRGLPCSPVQALFRATNKYLARDAVRAAGLEAGGFAVVRTAEEAVAEARRIGRPVVLKPLTGIGSSAVQRCRTLDEAAEAFERGIALLAAAHYPQLRMAPHVGRDAQGRQARYDPAASLLMEEYFPGREASVEIVVVGDRVVPLVVHDKVLVEERDSVVLEHLLVTPPERFDATETAELVAYAVAAVEAIGLRSCFCHVELRYVDGAGPRLLEVNPRIGAGCVIDSIETFWGFDVAQMQVDLLVGTAEVPVPQPRSQARHAMGFLFSPCSGVLERFDGLDRVRRMPGVLRVRSGYRAGAVVGGDHEEVFLASFFMQADDAAAAQRLFDQVRAAVDVDVRAPAPLP